jgi:hypothetical protein
MLDVAFWAGVAVVIVAVGLFGRKPGGKDKDD